MNEQKANIPMETENPVVAVNAAEPAKKNIFVRAFDGAQKVVIRMKSTKGGRAVIRITKATAAGLGLYGAYKLGQHSVKPATVVVTEGTVEEPEEPEAEAQEETEPAAEEANEQTEE